MVASILTYFVEVAAILVLVQKLIAGEQPGVALVTFLNGGFVVACAVTCMFFLAAFTRFARPSAVMDRLSRNAYGMYLLHYFVVSWVAYALLGARLGGAAKGLVVFLCAAAASLGITMLLRRTRVAARFLD
jgi:peptidoglycan/LPS O-acetylase OafA/YrhL